MNLLKKRITINFIPKNYSDKLLSLSNVPPGLEFFVLYEIVKKSPNKKILYLIEDDRETNFKKNCISHLIGNSNTQFFPPWDCLPFDKISPSAGILNDRFSFFLNQKEPKNNRKIIVTTINAIIQRLPDKELIMKKSLAISVHNELPISDIVKKLVEYGYKNVSTVLEPAEFAIRGGILDIWIFGYKEPVRLDYFGDSIESIKYFNPISQISNEDINNIFIYLSPESPTDKEAIEKFKYSYRKYFGLIDKENSFFHNVSGGNRSAGMEHLLPLFYDKLDNFLDLSSIDIIIYNSKIIPSIKKRLEDISDFYVAKKSFVNDSIGNKADLPLPIESLYLSYNEILNLFNKREQIVLNEFLDTSDKNSINLFGKKTNKTFFHSKVNDNLVLEVKKNIDECIKKNKKLLLIAKSDSDKKELIAFMDFIKFYKYKDTEKIDNVNFLDSKIIEILTFPLPSGFETNALKVFTKDELLGHRDKNKRKSIKRRKNIIAFSELNVGDIIVHEEHGVGKYQGLETISISNSPHDCLKIIYCDNSKLFVPVENISLISKYGYSDSSIELDKLGAGNWQKRKELVKLKIKELAGDLINLAAKRELAVAPKISIDNDYLESFCSNFPYEETDDQLQTIEEVFSDLTSGSPMDRLVCGDVGFGKTEIALRACFALVWSGYQVVIIVPTTLLAKQHYNNFIDRFKDFPVNVEMLTRMVSSKKKKEIINSISNNQLQVIIGTHALLSKDINFAKLGLVIVDEEQHFGVAQKEKIKNFRNNTHLLTLTATPIPRTFYMSLIGIRDLSLIKTPPLERIPIRTIITSFERNIIKEAIMREKARKGQLFCVVPRIKDIAVVVDLINNYYPELRFSSAHGKMNPKELDEVMYSFYNHDIDLLISTSIVESGIDIPRANTIIVYKSDMFGLAQLHQLRGRVGRSNVKAYAYFTLSKNKNISNNAEKRLQAIQAMDSLGSGLSLSSYDLDIRGAGNLLGEEQSGQVTEVGIELYQKLLREAVSDLKKDKSKIHEEFSVDISIDLPILIPGTYIKDLSLRLSLYRRLGSLEKKEDIDDFSFEMINRFGAIPQEFKNLIVIIDMKRLCKKIGINRIDVGYKGYNIYFIDKGKLYPEDFLKWIVQLGNKAKFRSEYNLIIKHGITLPKDQLIDISNILQILSNFK